jgi:hypothetical protein
MSLLYCITYAEVNKSGEVDGIPDIFKPVIERLSRRIQRISHSILGLSYGPIIDE